MKDTLLLKGALFLDMEDILGIQDPVPFMKYIYIYSHIVRTLETFFF